VAYLCPNTVELLEAYYGVLLAGGVLVPLNIRLAAAELRAIIDDCTAEVLVVDPSMGQGLVAPRTITIGPEYEALLASWDGALVDRVVADENEVCELFYTSGTTGLPKGAMLTHRNLATHAVDSALTMACTHRDVVLHTIPLFHVNGWGTPHWVTLLGGRHVMLRRFDPPEVLRLIEAEAVTRLHLVPTMATSLLVSEGLGGHDYSSLVQVTVGGSAPGAALLAELEDAFGCEVICGYGLTEAAPQVTKALTKRSHDGLGLDEQRARRATTGLPNIGVEVRLAGDGEILVRSNHVMAGYWNQPEATADVLVDGGRWLRTGDLATTDGKKDVIISGGENISSVEVEEALCAHPAVLEAAVVGESDPKWGEVPRAFVALHDRASASVDELRSFVAGRLAKFKVPRRIDVVAELPKGGSGKILKNELRRLP
jgi:fatty-acyl-CoA synthase